MLFGVIFAILSPAIESFINYFDKIFLDKFKIEPIVIAIFSGVISLLTSLILIFIFGFHIFTFPVMISIFMSGIMTEIFLLPYFQALSLEDTSTVVPLFQFVPLFIILGGAFILNETLTSTQYLGAIFIIISGLALILERVNIYIVRPRKAFWYMIVVCMLIALSTLLFKFGVGSQNFWYVLPYEGFGVFIGTLILLLIPSYNKKVRLNNKKLPKKVYALMVINEILYIFSRYCGFFALTFLSASMVGILDGLQPLFVLINGIILSLFFPYLLKEVITKQTLTLKLISILLIIFGTFLLLR